MGVVLSAGAVLSQSCGAGGAGGAGGEAGAGTAGEALAVLPSGVGAITSFEQLATLRTTEISGHDSTFHRPGGNGDYDNFLRTDGFGDNVVLDQQGPGCIYRIWFTGIASRRIKFYFDDEPAPRVNMLMSDFFSGQTAPFLAPLVGNDLRSSGGFFSYLPMCYRKHVLVTVTTGGPGLYYNIDYRRVDPTTPITSWTGGEDTSAARALWSNSRQDPKSGGNTVVASSLSSLAAGASATLLDVAGPRSISALKVSLPGVGPAQPDLTVLDNGRAHKGYSQFRIALNPSNTGVTLKRRFDYGVADQKAAVYVDGAHVGDWFNGGSNPTAAPGHDLDTRWRNDVGFEIPSTFTAGKSAITVKVAFVSSAVDWNEFYYWVYSKSGTSSTLTDSIDVGNTTSESAHSYVINTQTWSGSHTLRYPPNLNRTDEGRAHKGSSQFVMRLTPDNKGAVLVRRHDYGIADQKANVYVDGALVGTWLTRGSDASNRFRDSAFMIPASFTAGKSSITLKVVFVSAAADWNEFQYWLYTTATQWGDTLTDMLDVGDPTSEGLHSYTITTQTWSGSLAAAYPTWQSQAWGLNNLSIRIYWDNETTPSVDAPLGMLFGVGSYGPGRNDSLAAGMMPDGTMYMYFPMPFQTRAVVKLVNTAPSAMGFIGYEVHHKPFTGSFADVGRFKTARRVYSPTGTGSEMVFLDVTGAGHLVGVVDSEGGGTGRAHLEGDEHVYVDDSNTPVIQGTGTEDFYNGGWYFNHGPFTTPVHGNPVHIADSTNDYTSMYRLFLSDTIPFRRRLRVSKEHGHTNELSITADLLAYYYAQRASQAVLSDTLYVNNASSEAAHLYAIIGQTWLGSGTFTYEGEFPLSTTRTGRAHRGYSVFHMAIDSRNQGVLLRRTFDQGVANQYADVYVDNVLVGRFGKEGANLDRRWRADDFLLPASTTAGKTDIEVKLVFTSSAVDWNEFVYQTYSLLPLAGP
jgi:hypothetical protein